MTADRSAPPLFRKFVATVVFGLLFAAPGFAQQAGDSSDAEKKRLFLQTREIKVPSAPRAPAPATVPKPPAPRLAIAPQPAKRLSANAAFRVLMIGDSLSVGPFGESVKNFLISRLGRSNVFIYASCGSSPEHWLKSEPAFVTKCGYREVTPAGSLIVDFENGRPPRRVATPKIEDLLASYHPACLLVQLGTNWMDDIKPDDADDESWPDWPTLALLWEVVRRSERWVS